MAYIHVRTDGNLKNRVQKILKKMGLDMSTAINMYFASIDLRKEIPFDVRAHAPKQGNAPKKPRKLGGYERKIDMTHFNDSLWDEHPLPGDPRVKKPTKDVPLGLARGEIDVDAFMEPLDPEVMDAFLNPKIDL